MKRGVKSGFFLLFISLLLFTAFGAEASAADESSLTAQFVGNSCIIIGCDTSAEGKLTVPSEISGKAVTHIAEKAFENCTLLTEITLPDTLTEIGSNAFYNCSKLSRVTMTNSVEVIGQGVFYKCSYLENVVLSEKLKAIPAYAFYMCAQLKSINIPESAVVIGDKAFFGCERLCSVVLPEGVVQLSSGCFSNCTSLVSICIPETVNKINTDSFEKCTSLSVVYYTGNENSFNKIDFSTGNDAVKLADVRTSHDHFSESAVTTYQPDCTEGGYSVYKCPCGLISKGAYTSAKGHSLKFEKTLKEPSCSETGLELYKCTDCDYSQSRTVSSKEHVVVTDKEIKPTCTAAGKTKGSHCSACGAVIVEQTRVSPLGHDYTLKLKDSKHLASKATYKKASKYYYSCSRCKKISKDKTFSGEKLVLPAVKKLSFTSTTSSITLKWKKITAARGYAVYKKDSKGKWKIVKRTLENSFTIDKLSAGAVCNYAVRAYVIEGKTIIYAPEYTSIKAAAKPLPTSKITVKQNEKSVTLSWKKSKGATGYRVYRYDTKKDKWIIICNYTKSNKLTVKNLTSGRGYKFSVRSCIDTGKKLVWSGRSESITVCTRPTAVKVKATPYKTAVKLEWNKIRFADGYVIYMSEESNSGYKKVASTKKTTVKLDKLSSGKTYYFKVYSYRKLNGKTVYSYASEIKKVKTR